MASQSLSPADRIRELNSINADVSAMLESAGLAINTLTDRPLKKAADEGEDTAMVDESAATLEQRKEAFAEHTKAYYTNLQAVIARLRRQAYALEEAGIIAAEAPLLASSTQQRQPVVPPGQNRGQPGTALTQEPEQRITNGGLGNLDVGWLNSRGNKVGAEKESELIEEVKKLLEETISRGDASEVLAND